MNTSLSLENSKLVRCKPACLGFGLGIGDWGLGRHIKFSKLEIFIDFLSMDKMAGKDIVVSRERFVNVVMRVMFPFSFTPSSSSSMANRNDIAIERRT